MDRWRRKKSFFGDDLFKELENEFMEMEEHLNRIFNEISELQPDTLEKGPYVYGFSVRSGPEGRPIINEFGNILEEKSNEGITEGREPLIDLIDRDRELTVVAELPGVEKKDIMLEAEENRLFIDVDTPLRRYHKKLMLPYNVKTDEVKATYKNGILEVKLKKLEGGEDRKKIDID